MWYFAAMTEKGGRGGGKEEGERKKDKRERKKGKRNRKKKKKGKEYFNTKKERGKGRE